MRPVVLALAVSAGCAEPAIELSLKLPTSASIPPTFDLKCVTAIDMVAHPLETEETDIGILFNDSKRPPCVDLERPPENFTDIRNAMRGHFDIPIPVEGLLGIQIRGRIGTCAERAPFHEAIFYGGALYRDSDSLTVPLAANISCNTKRDYEVRPVDLLALTATKACPAPVVDGEIFPGNIRPTLLDPALPPLMFEGGPSGPPPVNGTAIISSFANLGTSSCITAAYGSDAGIGVTCIDPGAPTVCGEVNELEVPTVRGAFLDTSIDEALADKYGGSPTFVAAWETAPAKAPLVGATVTLADPSHGEVQFLDIAETHFTTRPGPTGPSGVFAVYSDRVQEITVTAPGHGPRKLLVGAIPRIVGLFPTAIAVLSRI